MPGSKLHKFFLSIVLPTILAITLFIVSIFVFILPAFERSIMAEKKDAIRELTNTAWSLVEEYNNEIRNQNLSVEEAQRLAALRIEQIRYGEENKDYFWIIDQEPRMIMHPYRTDLINESLEDYKDPNGKRLFIEATKVVEKSGEGFIDYMWQWKDDSTRIVPKLSYVRAFEPWNWIIGTGIYLEDVRGEIRLMKSRLTRVSILITVIICVILLFIIRQSLNIERKRKEAEGQLMLSRQKYKSLVEASTEGTLMSLNSRIIFSNVKFNTLTGYDSTQLQQLSIENIFEIDWPEILKNFEENPKKSITRETRVKCSDEQSKEVIVSISKIKYAEQDGFILITKEVTEKDQIAIDTKAFAEELQTSLLLMNQPIRHFIESILKCSVDASIREVAKLMAQQKRSIIFVHKDNDIIGVVSDSDLRKRVLAEKKDPDLPVMEIMTAPIVSLSENALIYEAILKIRKEEVSHLAVRDIGNKIIGVISAANIAGMQQNTVSYLIKEISAAVNIDELVKIHRRIPVLVSALLESGDKTESITRIISSVSDEITIRTIKLAIEEAGPPPCPFAFMIMGSEGRMEQTLATDQDNAIVYADQPEENSAQVAEYFREIGNRVSDNLNTIGYKYCKGEVMAKNPKWTQPLSVWKEYFAGWINNSEPKHVMEASIFFDFRTVFGNEDLIAELSDYVHDVSKNKAVFFYHMAQNVLKFKPPVSLFGNIVSTEQETKDEVKIDIKKILLPVVGFIRLYTLHAGITETNSMARLKEILAHGIITKAMFEELALTYNYLMQLRFQAQIKHLRENRMAENTISLKDLTSIEVATLKKILNEISNLQSKVGFDFKGN